MNLYLVTQTQNNKYDTFDSIVVCAESEDIAKRMTPDGLDRFDDSNYGTWCTSPKHASVELIGIADNKYKQPGIILASFNAG